MSYDATNVVQLGQVKSVAQSIKTQLDTTVKFVSVSGNTISFFKTADGSGTAAYTVDFPSEIFLDQAKTTFVGSFAYSSTTYPGATNPNLDGKPVLVLAVSGTDGSVTYSFLNMATLVDTYTVASGNSAKILTISGRTITVKISAVANNAITVQNDGLHVNISGKADKVASSVNGNLAGLDANGNPTNSGIAASTVTGYATQIAAKAAKVSNATANNLAMLTSAGEMADSGIAKSTVTGYATTLGTKVDKVTTATANNLAAFASGGGIVDSGISKTTVTGKIDKVTSATANRIAVFASGGGLADGGILKSALLTTSNLATDAEMAEVITEIFGS